MDLNKLNTVVSQFGTDFIDKMKQELSTNGSIVTGELAKSLTYDYKIDAERIVIQFLSEDYGKYVEQGRLAGKYPPISAIQKWCSVKGLPVKAAYPIAKNIYKFGIKPKPFLFQSYESLKDDFIVSLIAAYGSLVQADLINALDAIPKKTLIN